MKTIFIILSVIFLLLVVGLQGCAPQDGIPKESSHFKIWLYLFFVTFLPAVELRGAIPLGILYYKLPVFTTFVTITIANILITLFVFAIWDLLLLVAKRVKPLDIFLNKYLANLRKRVKPTIDKYGFWGLLVFVAIPLPGTGAYTGSFAAEILGMEKGKAFLAISLGVIFAGIIITLATMGFIPLTFK